jgi:hypothetical protein
MEISFSGVTPNVVVDTSSTQRNTEVIKPVEEANRIDWERETPGVCLSMVSDWFQKCAKLGRVTQRSELQTGLGYSLAQTAYLRHAFGPEIRPEQGWERSFVESHGFQLGKRRIDAYARNLFPVHMLRIGTKLARTTSNYVIIVDGRRSGHALGYNPTLKQFLDPEIGILQFQSADDFAVWFPSFMIANYGRKDRSYELIKLKN